MGRIRGFDEEATLHSAAEVFRDTGYEGTSVDDLLSALGLHRGSLYNAYGSKRGLFLATLRHHIDRHLVPDDPETGTGHRARALDLVLVAAVERGAQDREVADLVRAALAALDGAPPPPTPAQPPGAALGVLGDRLWERLLQPEDTTTTPPTSRS